MTLLIGANVELYLGYFCSGGYGSAIVAALWKKDTEIRSGPGILQTGTSTDDF